MNYNAQVYEANLKFLDNLGTTAIVIGIVIIAIIIGLICAIFMIERNTANTQKELKEIKQQNEYICQALNYIINNDGNFRADKPQYSPPTQQKQVGIITKMFNKEYR